jgi:Ca2+-binding RTX toxin-like protein
MNPLNSQARILFAWGLGLLTMAAVALVLPSASDGAQRCFGKTPTIVRGDGNNQIAGTNGRDVIIAGGGKDSIRSRKGKDFVCAGAGNDNIHAAEGIGYMDGGPGDDWLDGRLGLGNVSIGDRGDDLIQAEGKIDGGPGNDEIQSFGYRRPSQSPFRDRTVAGGGRDKVNGGSSGELLLGGAKRDRIRGRGRQRPPSR